MYRDGLLPSVFYIFIYIYIRREWVPPMTLKMRGSVQRALGQMACWTRGENCRVRRRGENRGAANVDRHRGSGHFCTIPKPKNDFKYLPGDLTRTGDKIVKFLEPLFGEKKKKPMITTPIPPKNRSCIRLSKS